MAADRARNRIFAPPKLEGTPIHISLANKQFMHSSYTHSQFVCLYGYIRSVNWLWVCVSKYV